MLFLASYDIVFQEVPGEVTLALNLSACPNRCPGCHSPHLREAVGKTLDNDLIGGLLERYGSAVTCVAWMGGDGDPAEVNRQAALVHGWTVSDGTSGRTGTARLKTAWYSGREGLSPDTNLANFDFIKLGPYDSAHGGLDSPDTNQRFYRIERNEDIESGEGGKSRGKSNNASRKMVDATALFRKKPLT